MSINARIKEIREDADLTRGQFGERIGLKQTQAGYIEKEGSAVSTRAVQLICANFHVSEEWLLQGTGSKYVSDADNVLRELAKEFQLTPAHEVLVRKLLKLPTHAVDAIADYVESIAYALVEQRQKEAQEAARRQAEEQARQEAEDQAAISAAVADSDRPANLSDEEWELLKQMRIEKTLTSATSACGKSKEA